MWESDISWTKKKRQLPLPTLLCHLRRVGDAIEKVRTVHTTLGALETTYLAQMPADVPTVLEASSNSFDIARRLADIGRPAKVLCSDVLSGLSRQDRVNDRIDAENLARAFLRYGSELRTVFQPSPLGTVRRETFFTYRDARKDQTRCANRIWSFCCRHGLDVDRRITERRCRDLLAQTAARDGLRPFAGRAKGLVEAWRQAARTAKACQKAIEREVFADPDMTRLQQVPGIRFIGAFAIVAFAEDIRRFGNSKKFVSYIGFNPTVNASGEKEGRRSVSRYGRADLKAIFVEGAQSALRTDSPMARWAKHLLAKGKAWNVVVCTLARKLAVLCWHILMGHPAPDRERQPATTLKLDRLARCVGQSTVRAAGYASASEYVSSATLRFYGHLPEPPTPPEKLSETA
jgi:transposase